MATLQTSYTDVPDVLANLSVPVELGTLVGANTQLNASYAAGVTSVVVANAPGASIAPVAGWALILDGPNSERVNITNVSGSSSPWTLTIPAGTLAAHAGGVSLSQAGVSGNLGDVILRASRQVEALCKQGQEAGAASEGRSLYQAARTEVISGPNAYRAAVDRNQTLILRPYHFPVVSVSAVSMQVGATSGLSVSTQYLVIPDGGRIINLPSPSVLNSAQQVVATQPWPRNVPFWVTLTYTGGPCAGTTLDSVPDDIREATYLLLLDLLSYRANQYGMVNISRGDTSYRHAAGVRGDVGAEGMFRSQAKARLLNYTYGY